VIADIGAWQGFALKLWGLFLKQRLVGLIVFYALFFATIYWLCYAIRFDGVIPPADSRVMMATMPLIVALKVAILLATGSHRGLWRQFTFADATALARTLTLSTLVMIAISLFNHDWLPIPRSIVVMDCAGTLLMLGGLRGSLRLFREKIYPMMMLQPQERVLIVGTGSAGEAFAHILRSKPELGLKVMGFLDPDQATHGWTLDGVKVLGSPESIESHVGRMGIGTILVPSTSLPGRRLQSLVSVCGALGVKVKLIPPLTALLSGAVDVRPRDVDIRDLLCRDPVHLDSESIGNFLRDRVVLVTGAAGSIGAEICRQVLTFRPGD